MKNKPPFILILFIGFSALAQEREPISGKVINGALPVEGILIVNLSSQREMKTDVRGEFTLMAKPGDTLMAAFARPAKLVLAKTDFNSQLIIRSDAYELEEVVVTKYNKINSESLGIVPADQKQYTVAERRLEVAYGGAPTSFASTTPGMIGLNVIVPTDGAINWISGRTDNMKKTVQTEKKEKTLGASREMYDERTIISRYKIPKEYVEGFLFYIVEDAEFAKAAKENNDTLMQFLMTGLAVKYLALLKNEE